MTRNVKFVFALDQRADEAEKWVQRLKSEVWGFKVGSILYMERPQLIEMIKSVGCAVFLDLKFHDIPNTVSLAVKNAFARGVDLVSVHSLGGFEMLQAAAEQQTEKQKVLSVSVLTSHSSEQFKHLGFVYDIPSQARLLTQLAIDAGVAGYVCSAHELKLLKLSYPNAVSLVPGLRLDSAAQDQKRVSTYAKAFQEGADYLVVGRDLYLDSDWEEKWQRIKSSLVGAS